MKHVNEWIQAYVAGELDDERAASVLAHLRECAECKAEADRSRDLWEFLGAADTRPPQTASVWPSVQARTLGQANGSRTWFFGNGPWMRRGLATAAVAAGLVIGVLAPAGFGEQTTGDGTVAEAAWLLDSSWLSGSSWLAGDGAAGLDDILVGADLTDDGSGS